MKVVCQYKMQRCKNNGLEDWVTNLATEQKDVFKPNVTKAERIEKRLAKKRRIDENTLQKRNTKKRISKAPIPGQVIDEGPAIETINELTSRSTFRRQVKDHSVLRHTDQTTKDRLRSLSEKFEGCVSAIKERRSSWQKPYTPAPILSGNISQRRRQQQANNLENWFQPRQTNYGGMGLARSSLFIALDDPSWQPKLEEEFVEHIPGFYGKQRTKAMKKQLDGQMLWRQLQQQKLTGQFSSTTKTQKMNGKKLSLMNPDERVDTLLRAGYI
jgi:hypothetical protein